MPALTSYDTQRLTRTSLQLVAGPGRCRAWLTAAVAMAVAMCAAGLISPDGAAGLVSLRREQVRLQGELERTRLELEMERATRAELEGQIQVLNQNVTELGQQLEFVNSRTAPRPAAGPPARPRISPQEG